MIFWRSIFFAITLGSIAINANATKGTIELKPQQQLICSILTDSASVYILSDKGAISAINNIQPTNVVTCNTSNGVQERICTVNYLKYVDSHSPYQDIIFSNVHDSKVRIVYDAPGACTIK